MALLTAITLSTGASAVAAVAPAGLATSGHAAVAAKKKKKKKQPPVPPAARPVLRDCVLHDGRLTKRYSKHRLRVALKYVRHNLKLQNYTGCYAAINSQLHPQRHRHHG
jgi:hypothetical protein